MPRTASTDTLGAHLPTATGKRHQLWPGVGKPTLSSSECSLSEGGHHTPDGIVACQANWYAQTDNHVTRDPVRLTVFKSSSLREVLKPSCRTALLKAPNGEVKPEACVFPDHKNETHTQAIRRTQPSKSTMPYNKYRLPGD